MNTVDQKIPLVIIGCGRIVELGHAPALKGSPDFQVTALVDPSTSRRMLVGAHLDAASDRIGVSDIKDAPARDSAVLVATPTPVRWEVLTYAIGAGAKAALVEKPLGKDAAIAARMLQLSERFNCRLIPCHSHLWEQSFSRAIELAQSGELGEIRSVYVFHHMTEPFHGAWPGRETWRAEMPFGVLGDLGYHALYLTRAAVESNVVSMNCVANWVTTDGPTIISAVANLRHQDRCWAYLSLSWNSSAPLHKFRIIGSLGQVVAADDGTLASRLNDKVVRETCASGLGPMYESWYRHAARQIQRKPNYDEAKTAVEVSRLLDELGVIASRCQHR
jgi:predicted dehydrogenase